MNLGELLRTTACGDCNWPAVLEEHGGDAVLACPGCEDILVRLADAA